MQKEIAEKLPEEILKPFALKETAGLFAAILLVVALVNGFAIWFLKDHTSNRGYLLARRKWQMLLRLDPAVNWLILGDSSGNAAVVPAVLDRKLNVNSVNLCTVRWLSALNDIWMLETYLKRFGPPKGVLIVHNSDAWSGGIDEGLLARLPLPWGFWERFDASVNFDLSETTRIFLARYLPLYSQNQTLSDLFQFRWGSFVKEGSMDSKGYVIHLPNPEGAGLEVRVQQEWFHENKFQLSSVNKLAWEYLVRLTEKYQFDVYLAPGPLYEDLYRDKDFRRYFGETQRTLKLMTFSHPRIHYLSTPTVVPKSEFESANHVVLSAARRYTERTGDLILAKKFPPSSD